MALVDITSAWPDVLLASPLASFPHKRTTVAWRGESSRAAGLEKARRAFILDMELCSTLTMPSTDFPSYLEMAIIVSNHALRCQLEL